MEKTSFSAGGSILAAILASLCCIGPVAVALLGVGSIGAFTAFESFRPYLIEVTALLLGTAFYMTYRKREVQCEDGTCKVQSAGKWNKISVWGATLIAVFVLGFPYLGFAPTAPVSAAVQGKTITTVAIEGMNCDGCAKGLEGSLTRLNGVHKATVAFEKEQAVIEYDSLLVQPRAFLDLIHENGFDATLRQRGRKQ